MQVRFEVLIRDSLAEFEAAVRSFLERREAENSLMLGLASVLQQRKPNPEWLLMQVRRQGHTELAAFYTGLLLVLSTGPEEAMDALVSRILQIRPSLPGVVGPAELADAFTSHWRRRTECAVRDTVDQRIYRLTRVERPKNVLGAARYATSADAPILLSWFREFHEEATPQSPFVPKQTTPTIREKTDKGWILLWEDGGKPVSMAALSRPTANGISVGPVYTPTGFRRRGYASAATAAASQAGLDMGKRFVVLYTNLANPTANNIYQKIGFKPILDSRNHWYSLPGYSAG